MYSILGFVFALLSFSCISLILIITTSRRHSTKNPKMAWFNTRLQDTMQTLTRYPMSFRLEWKKRISILTHILGHCFHLTGSRKRTSASSPQPTSEKHYGLLGRLGTISHILCVVVYGRTQLFITFRRQLIESMCLPRLVRHESSQSHAPLVNEGTKHDLDLPRCGETGDSQSKVQHLNYSPNPRTVNEFRDIFPRQVVISPSPSPHGHTQPRHKTCFPRRQMTQISRHPHFDMDSRLLSPPPSRNNARGSETFILLPSHRQARG